MRIAPIATSIAMTLLALAGEARAERRDCEVVFVRAPAEVRLVIESWLVQEPRCSGTIELRVVETESGSLYLIAQRPDGRIHEREVPDAQSAGVLVASWVADDWTSQPDEVAAPTVVTPAPTPEVTAPGTVDAIVAPVAPVAPPRGVGRWFGLGALVQTHDRGGAGVRFDIDLFGGRSSKWTLGAAFVGAWTQSDVYSSAGIGWMDAADLRFMATVARTFQLSDRWSLRASAGLGPQYTTATINAIGPGYETELMDGNTGDGATLSYEATLLLSREMSNHRWALTVGPTVTTMSQTLDGNDSAPIIGRNQTQFMVFAGARYRL